MDIIFSTLRLFAPLWMPNLLLYIYLSVQDYLPLTLPQKLDGIHVASYIILLLIGCGLFVQEIFSWQIAPMYHWLWLVVLGVPALGLMLFFWVATFKQTFGGQLSLDVADVGGRAHAVFYGGVVLFGFLVLI